MHILEKDPFFRKFPFAALRLRSGLSSKGKNSAETKLGHILTASPVKSFISHPQHKS